MNRLNEIPIKQYLAGMNIHPVKDYGYYGMYHCPFRKDSNESFKVDYRKNVWHDFGTNEGGTMIDLLMRMENCSFHEAATRLEKIYGQPNDWLYQHTNVAASQQPNTNSFSFHGNTTFTAIQSIIPISHPKLIAWVQERKIDLELANLYCREVHYRNKERTFFSIGFRNDRNGYELSSPPDFKSCIAPKDITTIRSNRGSCLVYEGFWDFLSYLTLKKVEKSGHDILVLNSVANVQKAMEFLKTHKEIYTYLDNDEAGQKATQEIQSACDFVHNRSERYAEFKDLNDYLRQKPSVKPEVKKIKCGLRR